MSRKEYLEVEVPSGKAWVLSSKISDLRRVDAIFFDCDGVLVDVRDSYDATIIEAVKFLAEGMMGITIPSSLPLRRGILELKRSGGFNNDWHVSYALLLGLFAYLARKETGTVPNYLTPAERERILLEKTSPESSVSSDESVSKSSWERVGEAIVSLGRRADSMGLASVERILIDEGYAEPLKEAKKLLGYPVEASIVARVFDEMFYGHQLFCQKFKIEPKFYNGRGFVERETPAVARETLDSLVARVGRGRVGIISGRDYASARRTLGELMDCFEARNLLFLTVDPDYEKEGGDSQQFLNKPNPEILMKAVRCLSPFQCCLYVGDSAEDLMMVQRANKIVPGFAFAGVYGLANFKDEVCSYFLKTGADMVLPLVNDIPELLDILGEWKK